jgi:hypothetical protein
MEVSPNALRKETVDTLKKVDHQLENYEQEATMDNKSPFHIFNMHGQNDYASLLATKAQCLNTLVLLNEQTRLKKR